MSRFGSATKEDIQDLHDQKDSLNTKKSVNHSVKVVREYCREKGSNFEFEKLDPLRVFHQHNMMKHAFFDDERSS